MSLSSMLALLCRRTVRVGGKPQASAVFAQIGGFRVTDMVPIKEKGLAKSGNISLTGFCEGRKVKVYSMFTEEQVELRRSIDRLSERLFLPSLVASEGLIVVEEWVKGTPGSCCRAAAKRALADSVRDYLVGPQRVEVAKRHAPRDGEPFDYLEYLNSRVRPWLFLAEVRVFVERWREQREAVQGALVRQLSNPDLSLQNLLISEHEGRAYCIDNEFLHVGYGGFMDFYNSLIRAEPIPFSVSRKVVSFYHNTLKLRHIGSALICGQPQRLDTLMLSFDNVSEPRE